MNTKTITIAGAGILGLWLAYHLAKSGFKVKLYEQSRTPFGAASSRHAGAMLAPFCEAESAPEIIKILGLKSMALWQEGPHSTVTMGTLVVAQPRDLGELSHYARMTDHFQKLGPEEIAELEPDLAGRFDQGLFYAGEAHLNPRQALTDLMQAALNSGAEMYFGQTYRADLHQADWHIDTTGMGARDELKNLRGVRGEMAVIQSDDIKLNRPIRLIHPRFPIYIVPWVDQSYMIGATMIESDDDGPVTLRSALELLGTAYALHPGFGEARVIEFNTGVRPAFPDNVPKIIPRGQKIFINGAYRHGFLLAPLLAKLTGDYIEKGKIEANDERRDLFLCE